MATTEQKKTNEIQDITNKIILNSAYINLSSNLTKVIKYGHFVDLQLDFYADNGGVKFKKQLMPKDKIKLDDFENLSHEELAIWISNIAEELDKLELQVDDLKKELAKTPKGSREEESTYEDAVKAIVINMDSFWSADAIKKLRKGKSYSYYRMIINIVENQKIGDTAKINMINNLK